MQRNDFCEQASRRAASGKTAVSTVGTKQISSNMFPASVGMDATEAAQTISSGLTTAKPKLPK